MASNFTTAGQLPLLPSYTEVPLQPVLPWIQDAHLTLVLPIIAYWSVSLFFHIIDEFDLFPQYRLHTPAEVSKRNKASRWDVFRDVILQQIIQTLFGLGLAAIEPVALTGKDDYNVAVWALRIRLAQRAVPWVLGALGVNALGLAQQTAATRPVLASILAGGRDQAILKLGSGVATGPAAFAGWELLAAKAVYWVGVPIAQFVVATMIVDTWQYFLHRAMHLNKWLYTTFHARHHRLYVPYAYGALYNHPFEGFLLDTLGTGIAYLVTGMTPRQSMWFFTGATIKTVDDHCGYALPFDPLQHLTANNAAYHDIHHQSWGIKTNFSQPFFTFWDRWLNTRWTGETKLRYERTRNAAEKASTADISASTPTALVAEENYMTPKEATGASTTPATVADDYETIKEAAMAEFGATTPRRSARTTKTRSHSNSLKGLRDRMGEGVSLVGAPRLESTR